MSDIFLTSSKKNIKCLEIYVFFFLLTYGGSAVTTSLNKILKAPSSLPSLHGCSQGGFVLLLQDDKLNYNSINLHFVCKNKYKIRLK